MPSAHTTPYVPYLYHTCEIGDRDTILALPYRQVQSGLTPTPPTSIICSHAVRRWQFLLRAVC